MKILKDSQDSKGNIVTHLRKVYNLLQHLKNKLCSFYLELSIFTHAHIIIGLFN